MFQSLFSAKNAVIQAIFSQTLGPHDNTLVEVWRFPGLIQSLSQAFLPVLSAWVEVGGIAPSLCLKASPLQPIST